MNNSITRSLEKYLITINTLLETSESIIVKDVAEYLHIGGASASEAIKKLKNKGFVNYKPYGNITLTEQGKTLLYKITHRHKTVTMFLNKVLDIDTISANKHAEKIEYSMTNDVLDRFVNFINFMNQCGCSNPKWINSCKSSLKTGVLSTKCKSCIGNCCCNERNNT